jgi:hypothetical protein
MKLEGRFLDYLGKISEHSILTRGTCWTLQLYKIAEDERGRLREDAACAVIVRCHEYGKKGLI